MHQKKKNLQRRYEGFLQTPTLWDKDKVFSLHQFHIASKLQKLDVEIDEKQRLGKYIEQMVFWELKSENIKILCENIQIQKDKLTLGELDCLLLKDEKTIHLEIIYKFYLFDDHVGKTEIAHFIGPNRKDTLVEKLTKLKEKQLPLLYTDACVAFLNSKKISTKNLQQNVYFKAQLFLPYSKQNVNFSLLNEDCVAGFYVSKTELSNFSTCKFYIPTKKDWIVLPHENVNWLHFKDFITLAADYLDRKFSPLFWMKLKNGTIHKCFLTWWQY